MQYKNSNDNRYRVNFMRATESLMDELTVAEFIEYLKVNGEFEDFDTMYLDGHIVDTRVYMLRETESLRKEFIVTEDGRLFYWLSVATKCELIDREVEEVEQAEENNSSVDENKDEKEVEDKTDEFIATVIEQTINAYRRNLLSFHEAYYKISGYLNCMTDNGKISLVRAKTEIEQFVVKCLGAAKR